VEKVVRDYDGYGWGADEAGGMEDHPWLLDGDEGRRRFRVILGGG